VTALGADLIVEVALRHEPAERAGVVAELCRGDAELEGLVRALLAHYERPVASLPAGPFPCELGPFTLERELGSGAHGKVYLARRPLLDGYVAVKLLRPGAGMSAFVEQVRREAGRARRIPSAHVVPVFDAGRIDGGPFYVEMGVCADPDEASPGSIRIGRSLREARAGLSAVDAARIVEDLARAVHAAHRTGVVHGDVKPENVLLTPDTRRVMLADFGLATSLAGDAPGSTPIGTVEYMAPEQWRDRLPPSEASDVYGLGGTLYFLLAGSAPHAARARGEDPPVPPLPASVPHRLRAVVMRALAPEAADRPASAAELAEELRRFRAHEPTFGELRRPGRRLLLFARRHLPELAAGFAVLAALLPLVLAGYHAFTGQVRDLAVREAALRAKIEELDGARRELERETARLEGAADAKQKELARVEARLQQLPKLDQALGAARSQAEAAQAEAARREAAERQVTARVAALEAELEAARAASERALAREAEALTDAGRAAAERDGARERLAELEAEAAAATREAQARAAALREAEARRAALERELREKEAALAAARAAPALAAGEHRPVAPALVGEPRALDAPAVRGGRAPAGSGRTPAAPPR
jgi:serine/threonine-protein kinase